MSISVEQAYPNTPFRQDRSFQQRLSGIARECIHLQLNREWSACYSPDTAVLNGRLFGTRSGDLRPEVQLCRDCLGSNLLPELAQYRGRVVAFEPTPPFEQYFFAAEPDFNKSNLEEEVQSAIESRIADIKGTCQRCSNHATWLWLNRRDVLDCEDVEGIKNASGALFCASHGARLLVDTFGQIEHANLEYVNLAYGEAGTYLWV